jgi:hypothetical protein
MPPTSNMMEAVGSYEISTRIHQNTRRHIKQDGSVQEILRPSMLYL